MCQSLKMEIHYDNYGIILVSNIELLYKQQQQKKQPQ